jgi:hypothetical protein
VQFDGARVLFSLIKFFAHELRKHLVDSDVGKERVVFLKQRAFIFILLEITLKFIEADDFSDAGDVELLNLIFKGACWVLYNNADTRSLLFI